MVGSESTFLLPDKFCYCYSWDCRSEALAPEYILVMAGTMVALLHQYACGVPHMHTYILGGKEIFFFAVFNFVYSIFC